MAKLSPRDAMAAAREYARRKAPYWATMILGARYHELPGIGTMAVTPGGVVCYDPVFVTATPTEQLAAVVVHECAHWMRHHHDRRGQRDAGAWNICTDASINSGLRDCKWVLPHGAVYPEQFEWPAGLLPEQYYDMLPKQGGEGGEGGEPGGEGGEPGQPRPGDKPDKPKPGDKPGDGGAGRGLGDDLAPIPGADAIDAELGHTEASTARVERGVAEAVAKHAAQHGQGSVPAGWATWANEQLAPPKVPWQRVLARACRRAVALQMGAVDYTYRAPSRRQAGMGFGAGKPVLPTLRRPVPGVALISDTSGSMGTREQTATMSEVAGVFQTIGAPVHLISCDAAVHDTLRVASRTDLKRTLHGGGGTDFRPGITTALALRPRPEVLVYCTDGQGTYPDAPPPGVRVIWVLLGKWTTTPPWGEVIEVPLDE